MRASTFFIGCSIKADLLLRSFVALGDDGSLIEMRLPPSFINVITYFLSLNRHSRERGTTESGISNTEQRYLAEHATISRHFREGGTTESGISLELTRDSQRFK